MPSNGIPTDALQTLLVKWRPIVTLNSLQQLDFND